MGGSGVAGDGFPPARWKLTKEIMALAGIIERAPLYPWTDGSSARRRRSCYGIRMDVKEFDNGTRRDLKPCEWTLGFQFTY